MITKLTKPSNISNLSKYLLLVLFCFPILAWANPPLNNNSFSNIIEEVMTISGTVSDETGETLIGVNVLIKGTSTGTITDIDGTFQIEANPGDILVFSYTGMVNEEIIVGSETTLNVVLKTNATLIEEVVVIGYGTRKKSHNTGAIAQIGGNDVAAIQATRVDEALAGKLPGVLIQNQDGAPGADPKIQIRAASSISGDSNPLIVVDGYPISGSLATVNPNDIESLEVLKDAASAAIYGSRGANGVIIITTKEAKQGARLLEFSSSISTSKASNRLDLLDREGFLAAQSSLGADLTVLDQGADTDWQDVIFRNAFTANYYAAFGGADENGGYRFSVGYSDQEGIVRNSGLERLTARVNGKYNFFEDKLKLTTQLTITNSDIERPPISDNANARGDLISTAYYSNPTLAPTGSDGLPTSTGSQEQINPAALLRYIKDETETFRTLANLSGQYNFTEDLSFKTLIGIDKSVSTRAGAFSSDLEVNGVQGLGRAQIDELDLTTILWENYFNYSTEINEDHSIDAILGFSYQEFNSKVGTTIAANFRSTDPSFMINNLGSAQAFGANSNNFTDELQSYFGRVNYSFKQKYLLTATLRADGSTRFGPNKKYGYFPSFAAAWRLSDEDFIPETFSDLKLRASYGITGNQEIPTNVYVERTRFGVGSIDNSGVFIPGGEGTVAFNNQDLQWEETTQFNFGVDYGFFGNRLTGSIDYYRKNTSDLLIQVTSAQPAVTPFVWKNLPAEIINEGVEFLINANIINQENLSWDSSFNIAFNKTEVTNYNEAPLNTGQIDGPGLTGAFAQQIANGQPLYAYFLREFDGFDSNGIAQYVGGDVQKFTGDSPLPDYTIGFSNSFKYKNFSLNFFLTGQFGHKIYNNTANALFTVANLSQGRNVNTDTAALIGTEDPFNAGDVSTRFLEDGSFLRLQDATFGYDFNVQNLGALNSLRLFVNAQNLFVITDYSGQDPEVSVNKQINGVPSIGIDYTAYPKARTFTLGLNVTF